MTGYVAIYARLSPRPDGSYEGVDSQERWGRAYATRVWPGVPVRVFPDAGISAANGDHRPQYEALREAIGRGEVAHVWTVEQTRLERREIEWFRLAAELDAVGITELHTDRDGIVRVLDEVSGIKAVLAAAEVRKLKMRVNSRLDEIAAAGRPSSGCPYGYRRGLDENGAKTLLVVEEQAAVIREAAERILAGWSLARVAADLNARAIRGRHGGKLTPFGVKSVLTNATVAGQRIHRGRTVGRGVWQPILDENTWNAVRDKLSAPRTVERVDGGTYPINCAPRHTGRRYLLTGGTTACGVCGAPLIAALKWMRGGKFPYYLCPATSGGKRHVGIRAELFEDHVRDRLLDELDRPAFRQALAEDEHAARRDELTTALRTNEGKRNSLAAKWAADEVTDEEWQAARRTLTEREQQLRAELAAVPPPTVDRNLDLVREAWPAMNLDERREIVGMFVERVTVKRATPGARAFDPRRVAIEWRKA
jgi:site-specific DNA recombinase